MIISTTEEIGKKYEVLGMVKGNTVQSKNVVRDVFAGLKTIIGGEIKGYTEMMTEAREKATLRMFNEAKKMNADAIVSVRYTTSNIMQGSSEILVFGTAVKFKK